MCSQDLISYHAKKTTGQTIAITQSPPPTKLCTHMGTKIHTHARTHTHTIGVAMARVGMSMHCPTIAVPFPSIMAEQTQPCDSNMARTTL